MCFSLKQFSKDLNFGLKAGKEFYFQSIKQQFQLFKVVYPYNCGKVDLGFTYMIGYIYVNSGI